MKNADIIKKITDYIQGVATERGLTHRDIANLCSQKGQMLPRQPSQRCLINPPL